MKLSNIRTIKDFCNSLHSEPCWREVVDNAGSDDFEVNNVRFISSEEIDRIQCDELEGDLYSLGCFNSGFLASVLCIPQEAVEAIQEAGAHEALGRMVISMGVLEELQEEYSRLDGYGHHFNSYDFGQEEITIDGILYYVFDNH